MDHRLLAMIARRGGGKLIDMAVGRLIPAKSMDEPGISPKRTLTMAVAGAAIARIATRSVPGAIVVVGGMLAKALYDRRRARLEKGGDGAE